MSLPPVVFPPPRWTNQDVIEYHGTVDSFVGPLVAGPVLVGRGKANTDFGPGFYTTTLKRQAQMWAAQISSTRPGTRAAVIEITINREALARLETLAFVRGDFEADDYWSLIHHCRTGALNHGRAAPLVSYDVVYGPVAAFWNQKMIIADADQLSFHTATAEVLLNSSRRRSII